MFVQESDNFDHDLRPNNLAGENHGLQGQTPVGYGQPAIEIKSLHTQLADLTDDELRSLEIVPEGTRLEQGATYFDLRHPDQDEFVAMGNMVAGPDNSYISKKRPITSSGTASWASPTPLASTRQNKNAPVWFIYSRTGKPPRIDTIKNHSHVVPYRHINKRCMGR